MILIRELMTTDYIAGRLYVGGLPVCFTLENRRKAIPCGTYKLNVCKSPKFKRNLPLIYNDNVKANRGIRAHAGNRFTDSSGCVLVGRTFEDGMLTESKVTETVVTALARIDPTLVITGACYDGTRNL